MKKNDIYNLLIKYTDGEATAEEIIVIEKLISEDIYWKNEFETLKQLNSNIENTSNYKIEANTDFNWELLKSSLTDKPAKKSISFYPSFLKYAAASILLIVTAWLLFYKGSNINDFDKFAIGKKYKTQNNQIIEIALSDGSKITLNQNSELIIDKNFNTQNRLIELNGEAYFEIAKNKTKPFIAKSNSTYTKVLGTIFKISSNKENQTEISLYQGKVKFYTNKKSITLTPGTKAVYKPNLGKTEKTDISTDDSKFWENKLIFKDEKLEVIAQKLEKRHKIKLVVSQEKLNEKYTISFEGMNLESSLQLLEDLTEAKITKKDSIYYLFP